MMVDLVDVTLFDIYHVCIVAPDAKAAADKLNTDTDALDRLLLKCTKLNFALFKQASHAQKKQLLCASSSSKTFRTLYPNLCNKQREEASIALTPSRLNSLVTSPWDYAQFFYVTGAPIDKKYNRTYSHRIKWQRDEYFLTIDGKTQQVYYYPEVTQLRLIYEHNNIKITSNWPHDPWILATYECDKNGRHWGTMNEQKIEFFVEKVKKKAQYKSNQQHVAASVSKNYSNTQSNSISSELPKLLSKFYNTTVFTPHKQKKSAFLSNNAPHLTPIHNPLPDCKQLDVAVAKDLANTHYHTQGNGMSSNLPELLSHFFNTSPLMDTQKKKAALSNNSSPIAQDNEGIVSTPETDSDNNEWLSFIEEYNVNDADLEPIDDPCTSPTIDLGSALYEAGDKRPVSEDDLIDLPANKKTTSNVRPFFKQKPTPVTKDADPCSTSGANLTFFIHALKK